MLADKRDDDGTRSHENGNDGTDRPPRKSIDLLIHVIQTGVYAAEAFVHAIKTCIYASEALVHAIEPIVHAIKPGFDPVERPEHEQLEAHLACRFRL